jgi:hypothetical protein
MDPDPGGPKKMRILLIRIWIPSTALLAFGAKACMAFLRIRVGSGPHHFAESDPPACYQFQANEKSEKL